MIPNRYCGALVSLLALAVAQPTPTWAGELVPGWEIDLGGSLTTTDTQVRADANEFDLGTRFDIEETLGLDDSEIVPRLSVARRLGRRHQLRLRYADSAREGRREIPFEIRFQDQVFPVEALVSTRWDFTSTDLTYSYFFYLTEKTAWAVELGAARWEFDIRLAASDPRIRATIESQVLIDEVTPVAGLAVRRALSPKAWLRLALTGLTAAVGDDSVTAVSGLLRVDYRAFEHAGIAIAGSYSRIDYQNTAGRFIGDYDHTVSGIQLLIPIYFD